MTQVNLVEKKDKLGRTPVIKFQLLTYCFLKGIVVSDATLDMMSLLAQVGKQDFAPFCKRTADDKIFLSAQSARNAIDKAVEKKLIIKEGDKRKTIWLNPDLKIQTNGNILLDYKFLSLEDKPVADAADQS
jgi:hypothetical protein